MARLLPAGRAGSCNHPRRSGFATPASSTSPTHVAGVRTQLSAKPYPAHPSEPASLDTNQANVIIFTGFLRAVNYDCSVRRSRGGASGPKCYRV